MNAALSRSALWGRARAPTGALRSLVSRVLKPHSQPMASPSRSSSQSGTRAAGSRSFRPSDDTCRHEASLWRIFALLTASGLARDQRQAKAHPEHCSMCGQPGARAQALPLDVRATVPSQSISTRAASRHRMAANGFRCRFVASAIVSAYDDRGVRSPGVKKFRPGRGLHPRTRLANFSLCRGRSSKSEIRWRRKHARSGTIRRLECA